MPGQGPVAPAAQEEPRFGPTRVWGSAGSGRALRAIRDQAQLRGPPMPPGTPGLQVVEPGQCRHLPPPIQLQALSTPEPSAQAEALPEDTPNPSPSLVALRQRPAGARPSCLWTRRSADWQAASASCHGPVCPGARGCAGAAEGAGRSWGTFDIGGAGPPHPCSRSRAVPAAGEVPGRCGWLAAAAAAMRLITSN